MRRTIITLMTAVIAASTIAACSSSGSSKSNGYGAGNDTTSSAAVVTSTTADSTPTAGHPVTLEAKDFAYAPTAVSVTAGNLTFMVKNTGSADHNFTVEALKINLDADAGSGPQTATVDAKPGTYDFHCEYHPSTMKGTITVTG